MFEKSHSKHAVEPESSSSINRTEQEKQERREFGKFVNSIVSNNQYHHKKEIAAEKTDLIELEPQRLYEIPADSKVPRDVALQDLSWNMTERAQTALDDNNIMAVIRAHDQSFWLLDMRENKQFADAKVPYLLIEADTPQNTQKNDSHSYSKGIRSGDTLIFGRSHDYGERFDYSQYVSRDHFEISCKDGKLSIKDLNSTNGTSVVFAHDSSFQSSSSRSFSDKGGKNRWEVTPIMKEVRRIKQRGDQLFITLGDQEYPCLTRDAETFDMSIDALDHDSERSSDILIDGDSSEIQEVYNKLKVNIPHILQQSIS